MAGARSATLLKLAHEGKVVMLAEKLAGASLDSAGGLEEVWIQEAMEAGWNRERLENANSSEADKDLVEVWEILQSNLSSGFELEKFDNSFELILVDEGRSFHFPYTEIGISTANALVNYYKSMDIL